MNDVVCRPCACMSLWQNWKQKRSLLGLRLDIFVVKQELIKLTVFEVSRRRVERPCTLDIIFLWGSSNGYNEAGKKQRTLYWKKLRHWAIYPGILQYGIVSRYRGAGQNDVDLIQPFTRLCLRWTAANLWKYAISAGFLSSWNGRQQNPLHLSATVRTLQGPQYHKPLLPRQFYGQTQPVSLMEVLFRPLTSLEMT